MAHVLASNFDKVCEILDRHQRNPHKLVVILQEIQHVYQYLPEEIITYTATALGLSPARVYGVATFYSHFTLEPKGKNVIRVCDGTACHVRKSTDIIDMLFKELDVNAKQHTTADGLFTVEVVACLGACGLAPLITINDGVHGGMTAAATLELLNKLRAQEEQGEVATDV